MGAAAAAMQKVSYELGETGKRVQAYHPPSTLNELTGAFPFYDAGQPRVMPCVIV
jgi:hypothetical protein